MKEPNAAPGKIAEHDIGRGIGAAESLNLVACHNVVGEFPDITKKHVASMV